MRIYPPRYTFLTILHLGLFSAVFMLLVWSAYSPAHAATPTLFNKQESSSSNLRPFKKWLSMLEKYESDSYHIEPGSLCIKSTASSCIWDEWNRFLGSLSKTTFLKKINKVNSFINNKSYIVDPINWGMKDYWATPLQFNQKNGDCEDYAIAKYISLKAVGIPADRMRIVILNDQNLELLHAVLAVYGEDGKIYILDNQIPRVIQHSEIYHYVPIYSINEHRWWKHY